MAKNDPNDLIFGKLIISNDFKRFDWGFLKILIFGRFFAFFGMKKMQFFCLNFLENASNHLKIGINHP